METKQQIIERRSDYAYEMLKQLCDDESLREVAEAVGMSDIPERNINPLFLCKVMYNKEMYANCEDLTKLVNSVRLQGLYKRPFQERETPKYRKRVSAKEKAPATTAMATSVFAKAIDRYGKHCELLQAPILRKAMEEGVSRWRALHKKSGEMFDEGVPIKDIVFRTLELRHDEAGFRAICLLPVDRYLSTALAGKGYEDNLKALRIVSDMTKTNLRIPALEGKVAVKATRMPVGETFVKNFLKEDFVGYSSIYFRRHPLQVWNDAMTAWEFSLLGRNVDYKAEAEELVDRLSSLLGEEERRLFGNWKREGKLLCVLRDADSDPFGYRTAVFAVYDAETASRLAKLMVASKYDLMVNNNSKKEIVLRLLKRDLYMHGSTLNTALAPEVMGGLAEMFGNRILWRTN